MVSTDRSSAAALLPVTDEPSDTASPSPVPGDILLIRHGRPAVARSSRIAGRVDWRGFNDWWQFYTRSGLAEGAVPPEELVAALAGAEAIVSSSLPRAKESAHLLAEGRSVTFDSLFVEAPLPAPPIPILVASPSFWWVLSRLTWWLGHAGGLESRRHAEVRAREAAARLIALSEAGTVALCGHGWFNRMIGQVLRREGWICREDGGDGYWSLRRYARP